MGAALQISLHTGLSIEECQRRLIEGVDFPRRTLASFSGYRGSKPVLGRIEGHGIELSKRKYYHNASAPVFFGSLSPQPRGTRIEGHFDSPRWIRIFWRFWCASVFLIVLPVFFFVTRDILRGRMPLNESAWVGLLVPPFMLAIGGLMPKFGRWLGRNEEKFLLEFVKTTLAATGDIPSSAYAAVQPAN